MSGDRIEPGATSAPPVVAVVVVHTPGPWFADMLASLARQDYPNIDTLFLVAGGSGFLVAGGSGFLGAGAPRTADDAGDLDVVSQITAVLPDAFVEELTGNPGFAAAANSVVDLVEGENGFFCFCHDDVALEPDAIRVMVEEVYRSNAGVVGPKLVTWDDRRVLLDVGLDVDRFGEPASRVDVGEVDQEQHDAVTDVFAVPSACLLVRADLFVALGGFDASMTFHGEDLDLCWRAHISGARVVVVPSAQVAHREQLESRRPDLNHAALRARHHLRSAITLTAGGRLPLRLFELVALTQVQLVVGVFTGHAREAWASLRALVGAVPRFPTLLARRGAVAKLRRIDDSEVHDLQSRGSNKLASFRRARDFQLFIGVEDNIRRWRERSLAPIMTWVAVVLAVLVASRSLINGAVPTVGEFLPFPDSPRQLWDDFVSGWDERRLGSTSPNPTGLAVISLGSVLWLFQMGLGLTVVVVGSVLLGGLGVWRLADVFPSNRERIVALVTYVAMPVVPGMISTGRLGALITFAALPWFVHLVRSAAGIGTADPDSVAVDLADGVIGLGWRERLRRTAVAALAVAVTVALAPPFLIIAAGVVAVLVVSTVLIGAGLRTAGWMLVTGAVAVGLGWLLNLPASTTWSWDDLTAIPLAGAPGRGVADVASMDIGRAGLGVLALALYLPVVGALALSRAWRLSWAGRAAGLVLTFGGLAVLQDRDALPWRLPEVGYLLVPVALGLALAAACAVSSFVADVAGGSFGWRQPVGLVSMAAVLGGVFPALVSLTDGAWFTPATTLTSVVAPRVAADEFGDFRVLYLGDPRLLPAAPHDLGGGMAMALTAPGVPQLADRWPAPATDGDAVLEAAIDDIASGVTQRGGRLLAPFGIRYVVVPRYDGAASTPDDPIEPVIGLSEALGAQLDLNYLFTSPSFDLYENAAAFPATASFTGPLADGPDVSTAAELVRRDLSAAASVLGGALVEGSATGDVPAGVVHVAVPFDDDDDDDDDGDDDGWAVSVDGAPAEARPGFGALTAFDVGTAGDGELGYESPTARRTALFGSAALWIGALVAASRLRLPVWLTRHGRRRGTRAAPPVIELVDDVELPSEDADVPVVVPLEPAEVGKAGVDVSAPAARVGPPLFRADDDAERAAWVEAMFADEDEATRRAQQPTRRGP